MLACLSPVFESGDDRLTSLGSFSAEYNTQGLIEDCKVSYERPA